MSASEEQETRLELDDIQRGALTERPSPYVGSYLLLRIDDHAGGRELVRRLTQFVDTGHPALDPAHDASMTVAFTYQGLKALGVSAGVARQLRARVPGRHGGTSGGARRRRRQQP